MIPDIKRGEKITAKYLNEVGGAASRALQAVGAFTNGGLSLQAPVFGGGGATGGGGGGGVTIRVVLINQDLTPIKEYDPKKYLTADDITLSDVDVSLGYTVVLQHPADDTDFDANHVDSINLWPYRRAKFYFPYFVIDSPSNEGEVQDLDGATIQLEDSASSVDDFYVDDVIKLNDGRFETVISYDGATRTATVEFDWSTESVTESVPDILTYQVLSLDNLRLAYVVKDDGTDESVSDNERKIVQLALMKVYYDDRKPWVREEYKKSDYPDYPENTPFPPDDLPDGFLKKQYRGIVINNILITSLCEELPPPELPGDES